MTTTFQQTLQIPPVEPLEAALERLLELAALPTNWDSYGAIAITPEARKAAATFLLSAWQAGIVQSATNPEIFPIPTGGIQFEWSGKQREIEIEISPDGVASSLISWEGATYTESSSAQTLEAAELVELVKSLNI